MVKLWLIGSLLKHCKVPKYYEQDNPGQNIWNKIGKSKKTGQVKESLISTFACFWTAIGHMLSNISRSRGNQTMKICQLI